MPKILITGSTGFAGRNIAECLSDKLSVIRSSRGVKVSTSEVIYFDLFDQASWKNIVDAAPDVIINAAAYGVIKHETDTEIMYMTNYFAVADLCTYLEEQECRPYWLQLGTAFEYDLTVQDITEDTPCLPRTHYGISKLMFSHYLLNKWRRGHFCIVRPFGMFGKYEDDSKFFPGLIKAQKTKTIINLSSGTQERDYIFINDLGYFINSLIMQNKLSELPAVLNIGAGKALSFRQYAEVLQKVIPSCDPQLWKWGQIGFRAGETSLFYSASGRASKYGFMTSPLEDAFRATSEYYLSVE